MKKKIELKKHTQAKRKQQQKLMKAKNQIELLYLHWKTKKNE